MGLGLDNFARNQKDMVLDISHVLITHGFNVSHFILVHLEIMDKSWTWVSVLHNALPTNQRSVFKASDQSQSNMGRLYDF